MARKAVRRSTRKNWRTRRRRAQNRATLKRRLLSTIRGTGIWTVEDLMQAVACSDRELLLQCCRELVDDGHIGEGPPDQPAA